MGIMVSRRTSGAGRGLVGAGRAELARLTLPTRRVVPVAEARLARALRAVVVWLCVIGATTAEPAGVTRRRRRRQPHRLAVVARLTRQTLVDRVRTRVWIVVATRARVFSTVASTDRAVVAGQALSAGVVGRVLGAVETNRALRTLRLAGAGVVRTTRAAQRI